MDSFGGSYLSNNLSNALGTVAEHKLAQVQNKTKDVDKAAQEFEAMFMSQMLNIMFDSVDTDKMFGGGNAEKIYKSMIVDQYSSIMSKSNSLGISDQIKASMLKLQEAKDTGTETNDKGAKPTESTVGI